jgi:hypothetical protein
MGPLIEELKRQEEAARAEAGRLRARLEELAEALARAEEQVTRLVIAREEVTRVLAEPAAAEPAGPSGAPAGEPRPSSPIGAVTVPPWREGTEASVLPRAYQDLLDVAADAGRPLRAGEFAAAAGLSTAKANVEGLRSRACGHTDALPDVRPPDWLDGAAGTLGGVEGRRVAGAAPGGRDAAAAEP